MKPSICKSAFLCISALVCIVSFPLPGRAESVGVILTSGVSHHEKAHEAFLSHLSEKGFLERLRFITQKPYPDPIAWSNASRKLIAIDVDVIVAFGTSPTFSVLKERSGIPVIFSGVYEPLAFKVRTKNATGVYSRYPISSMLRYLRAAGLLKNLGVIYCSKEEGSKMQFKEIKRLSDRYGFPLTELNVGKPTEVSEAVNSANVSALFVTLSEVINSVNITLLRIAHQRGIPTASCIQYDETYATILMYPDPAELGQETARKLIDHLNGKRIEEIPASASKNIEIVFNLKEALALGVKIPLNLVTEATHIIQ
jgi:ABC-type uncharacterized transport system substrate-binding protein